jgi:hypothetical protein
MSLWKRASAYGLYLLAAVVLTLLFMGKNTRTQVFVGSDQIDMHTTEKMLALIAADPGSVTTRGAVVVGSKALFSIPSPLALVVFLGTLPLLFLAAAHIQLRRGTRVRWVILIGVVSAAALFFVIAAIPRAS